MGWYSYHGNVIGIKKSRRWREEAFWDHVHVGFQLGGPDKWRRRSGWERNLGGHQQKEKKGDCVFGIRSTGVNCDCDRTETLETIKSSDPFLDPGISSIERFLVQRRKPPLCQEKLDAPYSRFLIQWRVVHHAWFQNLPNGPPWIVLPRLFGGVGRWRGRGERVCSHDSISVLFFSLVDLALCSFWRNSIWNVL